MAIKRLMALAALWCGFAVFCAAASTAVAHAVVDDEPGDDPEAVDDEPPGIVAQQQDDGRQADDVTMPGFDEPAVVAERHALDDAPLVAAYLRSGLRKAQCHDGVLHFLQQGTLALRDAPRSVAWATVESDARALIEAGCGHWPVHYIRAIAFMHQNLPPRAEAPLREALAALQREAAPRFYLAYTASLLARCLEEKGQDDSAREFHELVAHYWMQILHAGGEDNSDSAVISNLRAQVQHLPADLGGRFFEEIQKFDSIPLWLRKTLLGEYHVRAAWDARGRGWAHTVTPEGWRGFAHHLGIAREHLTEAYRLDPTQPYAASRMIAVVMAGHGAEGETLRLWYDRALVARPDWSAAHSQMLWALRPRWGGSADAMYEFGLRFVDASYDTDLPEIFLDAIDNIGNDLRGDLSFLVEKGAHATAASVIERLLARPRSAASAHWYRTIEAVLAAAEGKWDAAARALDQAGGTLQRRFCERVWLWPDDVADEIRLFSSSVGQTALEGREALSEGDFDRAADLHRAALAALDSEEPHAERVARLLREQVTLAGQAKRYMAGEWVNLTFGPDMEGWRARLGYWHSASGASVKGGMPRGTGYGTRAVSLLPTGSRFEAKADLRVTGPNASGGFIFHIGDNPSGRWIAAVTGEDAVRLRYYYDDANAVTGGGRAHRANRSLHVAVWEDRAIVRMDDRIVFRGALPIGRSSERLGPHFGLGCLWVSGGNLTMYENVQVRRLKAMPEEFFRAARD